MADKIHLEIDVTALDAMRKSGDTVTVLDVREPQEIAICTLDGSLNIRMADIPDSLDRIPKDGALCVMCHSGARSMQVTQFLRAQGFAKAQNVAGGIDAWAQLVDTAMARY